MRGHSPWWLSGIVALCVASATEASAQSNEPVKPYVVFILDTSGSMADAVTSGPPSCPGGAANKMDHAKCAIQNIAFNYGEIVLALGRFRQTSTDTNCSDGCTISGASCGGCNAGDGTGCTTTMSSADRFEVLVPLIENNQADLVNWSDYTCGQCTATGAEPELLAAGSTPVAGSLKGSKLYWQGLDSPTQGPYWTGNGADPIRNDPLFGTPQATCRPYINILMTDGDETCADFDPVTTNAAAALLTTVVDGTSYRIETKVIGFGQSPGAAQIEALAHSGGAVDGAGNEGFYAQNEEELELAISAIIANSIKFEVCDGADNDCDTLIDEGFNENEVCTDGELGACAGSGTFVCNAAHTGTDCVITDPGGSPSAETCDGEDDDCDGAIDEGASCGCTGVELCNGDDDDCDGNVDENLTRPCGTDLGICTAGTETCTLGNWGGCTATGGSTEVCSPLGPGPGVDEDCDGTVDGIAEECSNLPGGNPDTGPCHPGTHVCPTDGTGPGPCLGEEVPAATDPCNNIDDDCDTLFDEDFVPADCSATCGVGQTECNAGVIECNAQQSPDDETCNGIDDDCDGFFDEDYVPPPGTCDAGGTVCNGHYECLNGVPDVCVGESVQNELCNCVDDNCNTVVDEGDICPTDTECTHPSVPGYDCQCASPCAGGEFPCPIGRICIDDACLVDPCFEVTCPDDQNGDQYECVPPGECVRSCDQITCPPPFICFGPTGECAPDDCTTFPQYCDDDEECVAGVCVNDPCANVTCTGEEYCVAGDCVGSCADVDCPDGMRCRLGECEVDPCGSPCPGGFVCDDDSGDCVADECHGTDNCPTGEACDPQTGDCEQDPCLGVECPGIEEVCYEGSCFDPEDLEPPMVDAGPEEHVTAAGGGGCQAGGGGLASGVLALLVVVMRRRRRS